MCLIENTIRSITTIFINPKTYFLRLIFSQLYKYFNTSLMSMSYSLFCWSESWNIMFTDVKDVDIIFFLYICFWILLGISGGCITSIRGQNYKIHPSLAAHHNYDSNHAFLETQNRRSSFVSLKHFLFYIHNFFHRQKIAISQKHITKQIVSSSSMLTCC